MDRQQSRRCLYFCPGRHGVWTVGSPLLWKKVWQAGTVGLVWVWSRSDHSTA